MILCALCKKTFPSRPYERNARCCSPHCASLLARMEYPDAYENRTKRHAANVLEIGQLRINGAGAKGSDT